MFCARRLELNVQKEENERTYFGLKFGYLHTKLKNVLINPNDSFVCVSINSFLALQRFSYSVIMPELFFPSNFPSY